MTLPFYQLKIKIILLLWLAVLFSKCHSKVSCFQINRTSLSTLWQYWRYILYMVILFIIDFFQSPRRSETTSILDALSKADMPIVESYHNHNIPPSRVHLLNSLVKLAERELVHLINWAKNVPGKFLAIIFLFKEAEKKLFNWWTKYQSNTKYWYQQNMFQRTSYMYQHDRTYIITT